MIIFLKVEVYENNLSEALRSFYTRHLLYSGIRNRFLGLKTKILKNSSFFKAKFKKKTMMENAVKTTLHNKVY